MHRVAIFGAGKMGIHHIRAINLQKGAKVVGVADPVAEDKNLKEVLSKDITIFSDPEELLRKIHPDVVHICTPPETHAALAILALRERAHIYVEKPFSLSSKEAIDVISLANSLGLKVCAGHQLLFEPHMAKVHVNLKKLGKIVQVESYFSFKTVRRFNDGKATISPFDQLIDIMPHPVYLLLYFLKLNMNNPDEIPVETRVLDIRADGNVIGIFHCGDSTGILRVTLKGRPIESYIKVVGTNGSLCADYVRGIVVTLPGPGTSGISKVLNPYSQSWQTIVETSMVLFKRTLKKQKSYPGLYEIIRAFYDTLDGAGGAVLSESSIIETVSICEEIGKKLKLVEEMKNIFAKDTLSRVESNMSNPETGSGRVLITGGTGMLGRAVANELSKYNWDVRVISRKNQPFSRRIPGVKYLTADLAVNLPDELLRDISIVIHCAAETAGGKEAHERNTISVTRNVLHAMAIAGVKKLIYISSIAVLKSSRDIKGSIDENTELIPDAEGRGPYIWAKVEAEKLVKELSKRWEIKSCIIRPGPLIDYNAFVAPGRLGREVGRIFFYIGHKNDRLSLCSVQTAAEVIRMYVDEFDSMPPFLNLIEPNSPTRGELVSLLLKTRPDLRAIRIPTALFWMISTVVKLLQKVFRPHKKPLDIYTAFASEKYNSNLANELIEKSRRKKNITFQQDSCALLLRKNEES